MKEHWVGKTLDDVKIDALRTQNRVRVVSEDGEEYVVTAEYVPNRINVAVVNGIVTEVRDPG